MDYQKRRTQLVDWMKEQKLDVVLITSRENTRYFFGFTGTESVGLIFQNESVILVDTRYIQQATNQCVHATAVLMTNLKEDLVSELEKRNVKTIGFEDDDVSFKRYQMFASWVQKGEFAGCSDQLSFIRIKKEAEELAVLRKAVDIADEAWATLVPEIQIGQTEKEVAAKLEYYMRRLGASAASFDLIIASGYRSAMPHGVASDKKIEFGDTLVMDFGCIYEGYCSDITRTIFVGEMNEEVGKIYDIVLEAQLNAENNIHAGLTGAECDALARDVIEKAGYGKYFGHGLGHGIGILIHETPSFSTRYLKPIAEGSMLSVEPGIYVPGLGGVRIEDIGCVKKDHYERFTNATKEKIVICKP